MSLLDPESVNAKHPIGGISLGDKSESASVFGLFPIVHTYRGCHESFFHDLDRFEIGKAAILVQGRPCVELVRDAKATQTREILLLDRERDYVLVRRMIYTNELPAWQLDILYAVEPVFGWAPMSWEYIIRVGKNNQIHESGRSKVLSMELNATLPDGKFAISFPVGTRVIDGRKRPEVQYVVQADGKDGAHVPTQMLPTYDDLKIARQPFRYEPFITAAAATLVAVASVLYFRYTLRKSRKHGTVV